MANNGIYQFKVIDANTLQQITTTITSVTAGSFKLTRDIDRTNSIAIGHNVYNTKANQTLLGNSANIELGFYGSLNFLSGTATAPTNTVTPAAWVNVSVAGVAYKLPVYQ
jgi:hypothetical protein